jgi:hypothetical protein
LMLNHINYNKLSFAHFLDSSSEGLVASSGQTIICWKIVVAFFYRSWSRWLSTLSRQTILALISWLPSILTWAVPTRIKVIVCRSQEPRPTDSI